MINLIIGVLIGVGIMCFLQINRLTKMQNRINKAIEYINNKKYYIDEIRIVERKDDDELLEILGGDVDDK